MELPMSEKERDIFVGRKQGKTFIELGQKYGVKPQTIHAQYKKLLQKRRDFKYMKENHSDLTKRCDKTGLSYRQMCQLYMLLKRNKALYSYQTMSDEELLTIKGLGPRFLAVLRAEIS